MFLPGFPGINKCAFVAMKVMKKYHPKIFYHLKSKEYDFDNWKTYMLEYFMLWFCRCFHPEFEVRILDLILMEGWEIVFSIFSAILHYSKGLFFVLIYTFSLLILSSFYFFNSHLIS
ncbi:Rab GTPase activating protein, putative [Entamoeba histolytica KU27]|uniref:Rab GTPase activating protein, putative n=1 Tax=Entamoeba histolytica KU27 TaxID=885311 RepID=M2QH45_ENTHI|nr:Rab GTPase activating protein, putative [Entamoeba histolytica KU27]